MSHECVVEDSVFLRVPPSRVFEALTRGDQLARWWPKSARTEVREGGAIAFAWFDGGTLETAFEKLVPEESVAYPFYGERLEFLLQARPGGTTLTVRHACSHRDSLHIAGSWGFLKANLKSVLEGGGDLRDRD